MKKNSISRLLATGILLVAAMFSGAAMAAEKFADKATVEIKGLPGGGKPIYILEKTGEDKGGSGIYRLRTQYNNYLTVMKADAGTPVGWTSQGEKGSEWILFKNSSGWSIIAKANGANTVSLIEGNKLALQRNQGAKHQVWNIVLVK